MAISISLHLAILWVFSLQDFNDYDIAGGANSGASRNRSIEVTIVAGKPATEPVQSQAPDKPNPVTALPIPNDTVSKDASGDSNLRDNGDSQYLPAGRLTRAPSPLEDIDLNTPSIDEVAVVGSIELTVLIDETGKVVDASITDNPNGRSIFENSVIARFKKARFSPGEINGVPVKSRLQITVISEPSLPPVTK